MKKLLCALAAAALLLGGCADTSGQPQASAEAGEEFIDTLSKAERIDIYDGDGTLVRTLETSEELNSFFDMIDAADWEWTDEEPEEHVPREASFVFSQRPTETVLGGKPDEDERQEVVRLVLYEGSDAAYLKLLLFGFHMKLPEETLAALRELAQP